MHVASVYVLRYKLELHNYDEKKTIILNIMFDNSLNITVLAELYRRGLGREGH